MPLLCHGIALAVRTPHMTNIARLTAAAGLFTFATLAVCASPSSDETATEVLPVTDPAANDEANDQAGEGGTATTGLEPRLCALARPPGCTVQVDAKRALMITDVSVVEDAVRTRWSGSLTNPSDGRGTSVAS